MRHAGIADCLGAYARHSDDGHMQTREESIDACVILTALAGHPCNLTNLLVHLVYSNSAVAATKSRVRLKISSAEACRNVQQQNGS